MLMSPRAYLHTLKMFAEIKKLFYASRPKYLELEHQNHTTEFNNTFKLEI